MASFFLALLTWNKTLAAKNKGFVGFFSSQLGLLLLDGSTSPRPDQDVIYITDVDQQVILSFSKLINSKLGRKAIRDLDNPST